MSDPVCGRHSAVPALQGAGEEGRCPDDREGPGGDVQLLQAGGHRAGQAEHAVKLNILILGFTLSHL